MLKGLRWSHNALLYHRLMLTSCHFRDCKALLVMSLTHVSGAIASVQTFTFFTFGLGLGPMTLPCLEILALTKSLE